MGTTSLSTYLCAPRFALHTDYSRPSTLPPRLLPEYCFTTSSPSRVLFYYLVSFPSTVLRPPAAFDSLLPFVFYFDVLVRSLVRLAVSVLQPLPVVSLEPRRYSCPEFSTLIRVDVCSFQFCFSFTSIYCIFAWS